MARVESLPAAALAPERWQACVALWETVWPPPPGQPPRPRPGRDRPLHPEERVHLVETQGMVRAVARTWIRSVRLGGHDRPILALAGVCTHPTVRGQGLGVAVVRAAFDRVGPDAQLSLFQSDVPTFYERLGARCIFNALFDSSGAAGRFWSLHALIYPATAPWSDAPLDLRGPGW